MLSLSGAKKAPTTFAEYQLRRERLLIPFEMKLRREIAPIFRTERDEIVALIKSSEVRAAFAAAKSKRIADSRDADVIAIKLRDIQRRTKKTWSTTLTVNLKEAMQDLNMRGPNFGLLTFETSIDWTLFNENAVSFLETHVPQVVGLIEDETLVRVNAVVEKGIKKGTPIGKVAQSVNKVFTEMSAKRSLRIAQTETGIATNHGDYVSAKLSSLDLIKFWSNARDEKVRESHRIRGPVNMDQRFSNGLLYPMEPGAPAREVVNCRCSTLFVPRDEAGSWM